ncbi:MAG: hypothetical protein WBL67_12570 [Nitrososphaeraceae archaeon]
MSAKILKYVGHNLPLLENKIRKLTSNVIELEFRKKDLNNTIMLQHSQLSDLGQTIIKYQNVIDRMKIAINENTLGSPKKDSNKNN